MVKSFGGIMAMLLCAIGAMPVHAAPAPAWHPTHAWFAQYVAAFNSQNPKLFTSEFFSRTSFFTATIIAIPTAAMPMWRNTSACMTDCKRYCIRRRW